MQELAELLQNVPGIHSIDLKDVRRLAQLLRETPEIGSIEVKGWFGTGVVITRTTAAPVAADLPVNMQISPPRSNAAAETASSLRRKKRDRLPWPTDRTFLILSLDGGGIKGLYSASLLQIIEAELGQPAAYIDILI